MIIGNYRIGMRTFKTSIAVATCILLFHFTNRGAPMIACLTAIFA
ncbi:MAG: aromatic acid exporter family protein, partial [Carnobacterium sp.]